MANALYNIGRQSFLTEVTAGAWTGQVNWVEDDIWGRLVDTSAYTVDLLNDTSLLDVTSAIATAGISNKSSAGGTASASTLTFPSVPSGSTVGAVIVYKHTVATDPSESVLLAYIDTAVGLPAQTDGTDINIIWDGGSGMVFTL